MLFRSDHTNEPAIVVRQTGKSRLVYFPGDIERTMWHSGHTDLARLLQNAIRWVAGTTQPVTISGDGVVETDQSIRSRRQSAPPMVAA